LVAIHHDDQAMADEIDCFLKHHSIIREAASGVIKLHDSGMQDSGVQNFSCGVVEKDTAEELRKTSRFHLQRFETWVQETRISKYPTSLLFWTEELRHLHTLLRQDGDLGIVLLKLSRLLPLDMDAEEQNETLHAIVSDLSSSYLTKEPTSWLVGISKFIEDVCSRIGKTLNNQKAACDVTREVVVHSVTVSGILQHQAMLGVLQSIYKVCCWSACDFSNFV
jgi:hypothetical protein